MSLIPTLGARRKAYELAKLGDVNRSSQLWNDILRREFDVDPFILDFDKGPNAITASTVVKYWAEEAKTPIAVLWVESRHQSENVQQVEDRALSSAIWSMRDDKVVSIYVMTTIDVSFRLWEVSKSNQRMLPLHGPLPGGDEGEYVDADSHEAWTLMELVEKIKSKSVY